MVWKLYIRLCIFLSVFSLKRDKLWKASVTMLNDSICSRNNNFLTENVTALWKGHHPRQSGFQLLNFWSLWKTLLPEFTKFLIQLFDWLVCIIYYFSFYIPRHASLLEAFGRSKKKWLYLHRSMPPLAFIELSKRLSSKKSGCNQDDGD